MIIVSTIIIRIRDSQRIRGTYSRASAAAERGDRGRVKAISVYKYVYIYIYTYIYIYIYIYSLIYTHK